MLDTKVIVYDDSCPMCRLYTYWFVAWGFLRPENRLGFSTIPAEIANSMDMDRGRHEIPLVDRETGETLYGLNALTFVLGSRWKWLRPFFASRLFYWMFYPLYQIITYNRRVIAGCATCDGFDCAPDLNRFYRAVYVAIVFVATVAVVAGLAMTGTATNVVGAGFLTAWTGVGILAGGVVRATKGRVPAWDYFGNYFTATAIIALGLLPLMIIDLPLMAEAIVLGLAGLMGLAEARRRGV